MDFDVGLHLQKDWTIVSKNGVIYYKSIPRIHLIFDKTIQKILYKTEMASGSEMCTYKAEIFIKDA